MTNAHPPLVYEEVRDKLRDRLSQTWKPGDRLPPIPELARQLGSGQVNTGRAVRALVQEGLLVSRPRRGTFVNRSGLPTGYTGARQSSMATLARKTVVLFRPSSVEPFMDPAVAAAAAELDQAGAVVVEHRYRVSHVNAMLAEAQGDGVILFNPSSTELIQPRPQQALVLVRPGSELPVAARVGVDLVTVDSEQGGFLAGQWMRRCGIADVCFVGRHKPSDPAGYDMTSMLRLTGFEQGLEREVPVARQFKVPLYTPDAGGLGLGEFLRLPQRPQGVFCASDDIAVGFCCAALSHGLQVGRDFQLIGFDGQVRGREIMNGPLTTVEVPVEAMGRAAVKLLAQRLAQPLEPARRVALGCGFVPGRTAAALSPDAHLSQASRLASGTKEFDS